jgi:putative transposase
VPRTARCPLEPGLYHLTARGNRGEKIFLDERDRVVFYGRLAQAARPETFLVRAHCLMSTHYHLLVETATAELSAAMRDLNGMYARWFNKEHGFRGHVFEERFSAVHVQSEWHLLEVLRYLALNPVRAGLVPTAAHWRWGSYACVMGHVQPPSFLDVSWSLRLFSRDGGEARRQFASFVDYTPLPAAS